MIPFSPPRIDQKIIDEVIDTLRSGWITTGPKTKRFEKMLESYCGSEAILCLNSATAGLELMLRWFGVSNGDEVILPAYTYSATANVVVHCGAKPVFVDSGSDFNMDPEKVRAAINKNTKVIMPVDIGGWPCDYDSINGIASSETARKLFMPRSEEQRKLGRILVLSDAAHSLGAKYKGQKTGLLADCTVFSFHAVKNLTTAEGGAVSLNFPAPFNNRDEYSRLCIKALHGQNKDALSKMKAGSWKYDIVEAGYKMNMTDILAAIGIVELERYDNDTLEKRRRICEFYSKLLSGKDWAILPPQSDKKQGSVSSFHLFPLRIKGIGEVERDRIIERISAKGVSVNVHFIPLPLLSYYKNSGYKMADYPQAYSLYSNEISLPVYYDLSETDMRMVIEALCSSVEEIIERTAI